ncbi:S-adenosylmethionine decarboxylase proenzyme [Candidatus Zixiibacteriota bacterium]|nr:S-adenosylmethionine decarboxylase proenzyme [candidate division Zixibacteria bacterium]
MKILGRHLLAELTECSSEALNNRPELEKIMIEAARHSGATVVDSVFHHYNPQGLSGIVVIAESHISIHTWPEYGYAAVDCFTCGTSVDPWKALEYLKEALGCRKVQVKDLNRGIPSSKDEVIAHKTAVARPAAGPQLTH